MAVAAQFSSEMVFPELQPARQEGLRHRRLARHRPGLRADPGRRGRRRRRRLEPQRRRAAESVCREIREMGGSAEAYAFDVATRGDVETMCARVNERLRGDRHPGQQRRRHPRRPVPQDGPRGLGRGHQHQPEQRLRRHPALHRRHGRARLGPGHQHLEHRRPDRQLRPGQLRRRQGRADRPDQDAGPRVRPQGGHRQRHRARLRARPACSTASPTRRWSRCSTSTPVGRLGDPMEIAASVALPRLARRPASSPATCSTSTAAWRCSGGRRGVRERGGDGGDTVETNGGPARRRDAPTLARAVRRAAAPVEPPARRPARHRGGAARRGRHHARTTSSRARGRSGCSATAARRRPTYAEPVLFCYALVNRPYILDLQPDKSVVQPVPARGLRRLPDRLGRPLGRRSRLTLEDYVCGFLEARRRLHPRRATRASRLHLLGYCMGGTMSAMFTALRSRAGQDAHLLAAPIDFSGRRVAAQPLDRRQRTSTSTRSSTPTATARPGSCRPAS